MVVVGGVPQPRGYVDIRSTGRKELRIASNAELKSEAEEQRRQSTHRLSIEDIYEYAAYC